MQTAINRKVASPVPTGAEDEHRRKRGRFGTDVSTLDFGQLLQLASVPVTTVVSEHTISSARTSSSDLSVSGRTGSVDKLSGTSSSSSNLHGRANAKTGGLSPGRMGDQCSAAGKYVEKADTVATGEATGSIQMSFVEQRARKVGDADPSRLTPMLNDSHNASAQTDNPELLLSRQTVDQTSAHLHMAQRTGVGGDPRSWREVLSSPVQLHRTVSELGDQGTAQASLLPGHPTTDASPSGSEVDTANRDRALHIGRSEAPRELGDIVLRQVKAGSGEVQVKVHPEGMGDIVVSVQRHGDGIHVRLEGNQMQTVQWLSQQAEGITQAMKHAGVDVQSVEIAFGQANLSQGSGGEQPSKRQRDERSSWSTSVSAGERSTDTRFAIPELVGDSTHVNIRV
jgi:hypothetical protein